MYRCAWCSATVPERLMMCPACGASGSFRVVYERPLAHSISDAAAKPLSARELVKRQWNTQTDEPTGLVWAAGCMALFFGPAGSGKSTMAYGLAGRTKRPTTVLNVETQPGPALAGVLTRAGLSARDDVMVRRQATTSELVDVLAKGNVLILDSVGGTKLTPDDCRRAADCGGLLLVIAQVNKAGAPLGANSASHLADVVLRLEGGAWHLDKSRYQAAGLSGLVPGFQPPKQPEAK